MTLLESIDHLRKLAEAKQNGKTIQFDFTSGGWDEIKADLRSVLLNILSEPHRYRIGPEPKARPWSKPEDVPGPVCWIRRNSEIACLVMRVLNFGVEICGETFSWCRLGDAEYSTDRKTWHACTVTEGAQ